MASKFSLGSIEGVVCEEVDCDSFTDVTFYVKEKKKLCHDCALKKECIGIARKGGLVLYCEKHDKIMDLYCKSHDKALCVSCAMIDHHGQHCIRQDIEDALLEIKANLCILTKTAMDKLELCRVYGKQICQSRPTADEHLQTIENEVDSEVVKAFERDRARESEYDDKIDKEIDARNQKLQEEILRIQNKIKRNNEERMKRHEENSSNAEKRRQLISDKQRILHADIQHVAQEIERKIGELEKSWQDDTKSIEKAKETLDRILEDDKNIVRDGLCVHASVSEELKKQLNEGEVKEINRVVSGVRFVKGVGREKYDGRIDGYDGEWKLIDTINVKDKLTFPRIVGCIDKAMVRDATIDRHTYMLDLSSKGTQRVINGCETSWVFSCATLNDDKVVCGRYIKGCRGRNLPGCISIYDRQWNHINDVTIPRNTMHNDTWVHVATDQDGMIIAAESGQSKIYVINPADGKIISTIKCKEKIAMRDVLSSGHIIAQPWPRDRKAFIIDRRGTQKNIPHSDVILNVCVDSMTDDLYVVTSNDEYKTCVIDQVMSEGDMEKRRVASFPLSNTLRYGSSHLVASSVIMTSSGNMVACDGENVLIFKNLFIL
ncbi:uncharacterized protein LOC129274365 [Lytechinus pictus]|uniref:uncharacterized protein LOC129274365 n=1 Tax=Lytechinus pictus TaxID=7653 RepID=UPI0030B9BB99